MLNGLRERERPEAERKTWFTAGKAMNNCPVSTPGTAKVSWSETGFHTSHLGIKEIQKSADIGNFIFGDVDGYGTDTCARKRFSAFQHRLDVFDGYLLRNIWP